MKPKPFRQTTAISRFLLASFLLASANFALAQSTWNLTGGGSWNNAINWTGGIPDSETSIATFSQNFTGSPVVTLDKADGFTVNQINYEDTGTTGDVALSISAGTGGKLILAGTTTPTINTVNNLTISAALDGAALTKTGAGTLTLSGANTYSGTTSISAGSITVEGNHSGGGGWSVGVNAASTALTFAAGSTISVGAGHNVATANGNGTANAQRNIVVAGSVTTSSTSDLKILGRNTVSINSGGSWNMQGGTLTIQPLNTSYSSILNVNADGSFTYSGTNTIIVAEATSSNSGSGSINLKGTFTTSRGFSNSGAGTGSGTSNFNFDGGTLKISNNITAIFTQGSQPFNITTGTGGGVIDTNGFNTATSVGITGAGGLSKASPGTLTLSGTNSYTGGTHVLGGVLNTTQASALASYSTAGKVVINGGTLGVRVGGSGWTTGEVDTMLTNATKTSGALGIDTTNGSLTQWTAFTTTNLGASLGLNKLGANTLTLDQTNTYNGATTISAGTLFVTGALSNSAVTVEANGTIASNGSTGTLGNGLTIQEGGNLDLTGATIGLNSTGILSLTGGSLTLGNLTFQDLTGWDWFHAEEGAYKLIDGTFSINWGTTAYLSEETAYDFGNGKRGYFTSGSLNAVIIPEPGAALLGGLGLLALLRRSRRFA